MGMTKFRLGGKWLYAVAVGLYAVLFSFWQIDPVPIEAHVAAIVVWALALFPLLQWYDKGHEGAPMFELICLMYGIAYSVPVYILPHEIVIMSQDVAFAWPLIFQCLLLAGVGILALIAGYYATLRVTGAGRVPRLNFLIDPMSYSFYVKIALAVGLGSNFLTVLLPEMANPALGAILRVISSQYYIALVLLSYQVLGAVRPVAAERMLLWGSVAVGTLFGLSGGMLETIFLPLALVFIVRWHVRRRFPIWLAAAGAGILLILTPLKGEYRDMTWGGEYSGAGPIERLSAWLIAANNVFGGDSASEYNVHEKNLVQQSTGRVDLLHKFAQVRSLTPSVIPYLAGASYSYLFYTYIPRVLWPGKPIASEATDLVDFAYGFRSSNQESHGTNIGVGLIAEAFANFGDFGVVGILGLQGVIFALLQQALNGPRSVGGRAIFLTVMIFFLNGIGTSAVVLFGSILQFVVASAVLIRLFSFGRTKPAGFAPVDMSSLHVALKEDVSGLRVQSRSREPGSP